MIDIIKGSSEFVVIDIETSHFHPEKGGMIIEVAAVKIVDGKIVDKRTQLVNPERKISKKITEITGITNEMLEGKQLYRQILPKFYDFIGNAVVVGHNVKFDWDRFLLHFFKKLGIFPQNKTIDTLTLSKKYIESEKYKLEVVCEKLGIEHNNKHRALGDALATAKVFLRLIEIINEKEGETLGQLTFSQEKEYISGYKLANKNNQIFAKPQSIRNIQPWEKKSKDSHLKRIYVTLDRSVVFYDVLSSSWEAKSTNEPLDFNTIEKKALEYLNVGDISDAANRYFN